MVWFFSIFFCVCVCWRARFFYSICTFSRKIITNIPYFIAQRRLLRLMAGIWQQFVWPMFQFEIVFSVCLFIVFLLLLLHLPFFCFFFLFLFHDAVCEALYHLFYPIWFTSTFFSAYWAFWCICVCAMCDARCFNLIDGILAVCSQSKFSKYFILLFNTVDFFNHSLSVVCLYECTHFFRTNLGRPKPVSLISSIFPLYLRNVLTGLTIVWTLPLFI